MLEMPCVTKVMYVGKYSGDLLATIHLVHVTTVATKSLGKLHSQSANLAGLHMIR